jgi:mRNA interferase HigB
VNVISKRGLRKLIDKHTSTEAELLEWYRIAQAAEWTCLTDVRIAFPSADLGGQVLVFNVGHNRFRLIVTVFFPTREIYVKALLTHKEYDQEEWKRWC